MSKKVTKSFKNSNAIITISDPNGNVYELTAKFEGFIHSSCQNDNILELQFYNHSDSDYEIVEKFLGELNSTGYRLK